MLTAVLHTYAVLRIYMGVIIWVFTPCGELCFSVLEVNTASIFSMSELV